MGRPSTLFEAEAPKQFKHHDLFGLFLLICAGAFGACGVATQVVAWQLGFHSGLPGTPNSVDPGIAQSFSLLGPILFSVGLLGVLTCWLQVVRNLFPLRRTAGLGLLLCVAGLGIWAYSLPLRYAPYRLAHWGYLFSADPTLFPYVRRGMALASLLGLCSALGTFLFVGGARWKISENFGSSRWGDGSWFEKGPRALKSAALKKARSFIRRRVPGSSLLLGSAEDVGFPIGKLDDRRMLYDRSGMHTFVAAPTGAGKTVGFSIPSLLMHPGSALVVDIKRELYHVTARRRMEINGAVHRLDPFGDQTGGYNPMDLINTEKGEDMLALDDARMIGNMCIIETGRESNPFFIQSAKQLWSTIIAAISYNQPRYLIDTETGEIAVDEFTGALLPNPKRSLPHARTILMLSTERLRGYLQSFMGDEDVPLHVRQNAAQYANTTDKEVSFLDILKTARQQTEFLDSPYMRRVLTKTSMRFSDLKRKEATVFLVLPDGRLDDYNRWLRLMIRCAQTEVTRIKKRPKHPILFLLDEFPRMGRFMEIDKGVSLHRSYGIQYAIIVQTMAQLKETYGDLAQNFFANPKNRILGAATDTDSAETISKLSGDTTVAIKNSSQNRSRSKGKKGGSNKGIGQSIQEKGRKLVTPGEAMVLPDDSCFVFTRSQYPLVVERPNYLTDAHFSGLYDPNPEHSTAEEFEKARLRRVELGIERFLPGDELKRQSLPSVTRPSKNKDGSVRETHKDEDASSDSDTPPNSGKTKASGKKGAGQRAGKSAQKAARPPGTARPKQQNASLTRQMNL